MLQGIKNLFASDDPDPVCSAIVVAAGKGERMHLDVKKQFLPLLGMPVLARTLEAIEKCDAVKEIIVVVSEEDLLKVKDIVLSADCEKVTKIIAGGRTRTDSVAKGLREVMEESTIVMIHDGVRPLIQAARMQECIRNAAKYGASALGVTPKNTIKKIDKNNQITETVDRDSLVEIQTPQCFQKELICRAYESYDPSATDDCMLVEALGAKVYVTEGSYANLKLTTKEDLAMLSALIDTQYEDEE